MMTVYAFLIAWLILDTATCEKAAAPGTYASCAFPALYGVPSRKTVPYDRKVLKCIECETPRGKIKTLIPLESFNASSKDSQCARSGQFCNGMRCINGNWTCIKAHQIARPDSKCVRSRVVVPPNSIPQNGGKYPPTASSSASQIPLIIGFTVGGILLAIVIAGVVLGRNQKPDVTETSEMMTTPMSLSNSEWLSNGGGGSSNGRQIENLRVQEASTEDVSSITMRNIYNEKSLPNGHVDYITANMNDTSSWISQNSYYGIDATYQNDYATLRSSHSDVVVLDDGYVTGGNFIGSPELMKPKATNCGGDENGKEVFYTPNNDRGRSQGTFWGEQLPGNMTQDSITLSVSHSPHYGEIEYAIQDEDMVAFVEPSSRNKLNNPSISYVERLNENEESTMQISVQYREGDSDFEENDSTPSLHLDNLHSGSSESGKTSKTCVASQDIDPRNSQNCASNNVRSGLDVESGSSESGMGVSCHGKDSCEFRVVSSFKRENSSKNVEISCHARSWNENCKGANCSSVDMAPEQFATPKRQFLSNRSKSCNWKSPAAPTHSSSRKLSVPLHCPSSAPDHVRPHMANLTHVFVDVHRNMLSSDEDLLACNRSRDSLRAGRRRKVSSFSSSDGDSMNDLVDNDDDTFRNSLPRPYTSPPHTLRNQKSKSMHARRFGPYARTPEWKPRTVRFSSSGSGEYAIPYGSVVP